jgi:hypothetical protein
VTAANTVLERQLGKEKARFDRTDRAFLAALLHRLPRDVLRKVRLLVRPHTVLRWHRDLLTRRHAAVSRPKRPKHGRIPACDFLETVTLTGTRMYVFAVIEHSSRRVRILALPRTPPPHGWYRPPRTSSWTSKTTAPGRGS